MGNADCENAPAGDTVTFTTGIVGDDGVVTIALDVPFSASAG
ncbi:hypothetical protein AB0301_16610 [Microbacterium profundi]|uniref:DUF5666 domain-containing protein n=1 Tax=Microbacterium profundi TaxID=450380 RepID=A0ABV3LLD6_9MICO